MSLPRRTIPRYSQKKADQNEASWWGSTIRVDVVDELGEQMIWNAQSIHANNVDNRSNPSVLVRFKPKKDEKRFVSFVTEVIEALSSMERKYLLRRPESDHVASWFSQGAEAGPVGVLRPKGGAFDAFFGQVTEAGSTMAHSISVLRLWAHAYVDEHHVPIGEAILADKPFRVEHIRKWSATLLKLKPYFSRHPATRFEFRGCGVANAEGLDTMRELASLWGIAVHAARNNQAKGMDWDGPVVEVLPNGVQREVTGVTWKSLY